MDETALVEFPTQEDIQVDLRDVFLGAIRVALETLLDAIGRVRSAERPMPAARAAAH